MELYAILKLIWAAILCILLIGLGLMVGMDMGVGTIGTVAAAMFPFFVPSTTAPDQSLTIWNSSASAYGLSCMLVVALVFVPIILSYTSWCYYVMRGKVRTADIMHDSHSY